MRCRQRLRDLRTRAEAGICQTLGPKTVERLLVMAGPLRLDNRRLVPSQAQPFQVFENAIHEFGAATSGVEIFYPQQEFAAAFASMRMANGCRIGMAKVQPSRRRGGETCDLQDSLHGKGDIGDS